MKKTILTLIFIAAVLAVCISGCLGNGKDLGENNSTPDAPPENLTDTANTTPDNSNDTPGSAVGGDSTSSLIFNGSVVTIEPLPPGIRHLATRSVTGHTQGLGIPDALVGYRNMMVFESDNENVYFSVYKCTAKTADEYIDHMKYSHVNKYGSDSNISTITVNGHNATLLEATVSETPAEGRYILVWSNWSGDPYDDSYLVIVNGKVNYSVIKDLAEASDL